MEQAQVVIVGAGPAGLFAGLALDQRGIKSIILERESGIVEDPRGVYLAGEAVRILYSLGLGSSLGNIGYEPKSLFFHTSNIKNPPFHTLKLGWDVMNHALPTAILQIQPELEKALRESVKASRHCTLRTGTEVHSLQSTPTGTQITTSHGSLHAKWLIGADGKRGVVRKTFLEPLADIRQVDSAYRYSGVWVAANLHIHLPTPEKHPDFPAWKLGMTPIEVYDLFWPQGWHFASPPGKATATGRFGPPERRLWRHEYKQDDWNDSMDAEKMFWEHLTPMITRSHNADGTPFGQDVVFPRDCIEILRCRPFKFVHKVVNKWFHNRNVLIGDAAHVYPPFGGQGIASGIRDAQQLAWRIALLENTPHVTDDTTEQILAQWARERTESVRDAAEFTRINGLLCNEPAGPVRDDLLLHEEDIQTIIETKGFTSVDGGFFLKAHGGGLRLPQVYVDVDGKEKVLSDSLIVDKGSVMRVLVLAKGGESLGEAKASIKALLEKTGIPEDVLSAESTYSIHAAPNAAEGLAGESGERTLRSASFTPVDKLSEYQAKPGYDTGIFETRLGKETKFVVVRPDFFAFATARDEAELAVCLTELERMLKT